jgi:ABC-type multidrug transport system fused ATPase/permease subunit
MPHLPYRELPDADPGAPPLTSATRYLIWLAGTQRGLLTLNAVFGVGWMACQALVWAAVGDAIDHGINNRNPHELLIWVGIVMGLGITQAIFGSLRHQLAVTNWMHASFRTSQLVGRHATTVGTALTDEIPAGDVVNTIMADAMRVGGAYDSFARFLGSIVAWLVVSLILLNTSLQLGLIVLVGVPVLTILTTPLLKPLHRAQAGQREASGRLAAQASDTVIGLRILRGVGGEDVFFDNYCRQNDKVRLAGFRIATPSAALDSGQIFLPAILTVIITFLGAHDVMNHTLQPGQLVSFFGYTTFLTTPLRTAIEYVMSATRAYVGGNKVVRLMSIAPTIAPVPEPMPWPDTFTSLADHRSGVRIERNSVVGLVSAHSVDLYDIVDRLGRFSPDAAGATLNGVDLSSFAVEDIRRHIVVSEIEPLLFSGPLRDELSTNHADDETILAALTAASATDLLEQLDRGLDTWVEERGRSFSGGQRQRLSLARALLTNADVLMLMEPTSAVDTHTESRIAQRLRQARQGRTTVLVTSSPLLLEATDYVYLFEGTRIVAQGQHADLVRTSVAYQRVVLRTDDA